MAHAQFLVLARPAFDTVCEMSEGEKKANDSGGGDSSGPKSAWLDNKRLRSGLFLGLVGTVLVTAIVLGRQGGAIPMPSNHPEHGKQHQLRVNLKGELIGLEVDPPVDPTIASQPGFAADKKAAEKAVNTRCAGCHTKLSEHHPPKPECIKCHRQASPSVPSK
jgi:hypothetical protein